MPAYYCCMRIRPYRYAAPSQSKLATQRESQKDFYNHKVHGKLYAPGNFVWLHSPVIGKGKSLKLHHSWTRPYKVIKILSTGYRNFRDVNSVKWSTLIG